MGRLATAGSGNSHFSGEGIDGAEGEWLKARLFVGFVRGKHVSGFSQFLPEKSCGSSPTLSDGDCNFSLSGGILAILCRIITIFFGGKRVFHRKEVAKVPELIIKMYYFATITCNLHNAENNSLSRGAAGEKQWETALLNSVPFAF